MADLIPRLDRTQRLVLETLYRVFRETRDWPRYQYVASVLDDENLDLQRTLESMPPGLYWPRNAGGVVWHSDEEVLGLRVRGLACCRDADVDIACLLTCVRFVVQKRREARPPSPQSVVEPTLRFADFIEPIASIVGANPELYRVLLVLELMKAEPFLPSWAGSLDDPVQRHVRLSRDVLRFRHVQTLTDLLEAIPDDVRPPPVQVIATRSDEVAFPAEPLSPDRAQRATQGEVDDDSGAGDDREAHPTAARRRERGGRSRRTVIAWLVAAVVIISISAWFAVSPGRTSGGVAIIAAGLAVTGAIAVAAGRRASEPALLLGLATLALGAVSGGAAVLEAGGDGGRETSAATTTELRPPPDKAPAGLPPSGPTLDIWNKVTSGAKLMRDDDSHPAYLSTVPRNFCKDADCAIPGTNVLTGATIGPAVCQHRGAETTNGDTRTTVDDKNPGLYSSDTWYGVRQTDDTIGYISDVWVHPSQRGGLGLPDCRSP